MRCSFAIPRSTKELRSRGCGARESAGASNDPGHAGFFLRGARRAVSVLTWIACAVAPPYGRAEVSHPGGDASAPAGDANATGPLTRSTSHPRASADSASA